MAAFGNTDTSRGGVFVRSYEPAPAAVVGGAGPFGETPVISGDDSALDDGQPITEQVLV